MPLRILISAHEPALHIHPQDHSRFCSRCVDLRVGSIQVEKAVKAPIRVFEVPRYPLVAPVAYVAEAENPGRQALVIRGYPACRRAHVTYNVRTACVRARNLARGIDGGNKGGRSPRNREERSRASIVEREPTLRLPRFKAAAGQIAKVVDPV